MNNGIKSNLIIEDELSYLTRLYGKVKFSEIWESCKPKIKENNINFGKFVCFETVGKLNK